jgi:hypothetical protein
MQGNAAVKLEPAKIPATTTEVATGKFVKIAVKGMPKKKTGQYRGKGTIAVTPTGIMISGSHVYTMGQRWAFGLALWIGILILTGGKFAPGFLLIYLAVEYQWLTKGNQTISFNRIKAFKSVPEKNLVAIHFIGTPWETPLVLKSDDWQSVYDALVARVPRARIE